MKQKYISLYMDWCNTAAELSHAKRLKVGAVIVKDDTVISYGYNGMPSGWDNDCETKVYGLAEESPYLDNLGNYKLVTKCQVLHAEMNAIAKLAKSHNSGLGADLFVTHSPCLECAKLIYQAGIARVFYAENYRSKAGIDFLTKSGLEVIKVD